MLLSATERKTRLFFTKPPKGFLRSETTRRSFDDELISSEGVGSSPSVKKPLVVTKGEREEGLVSFCHRRCTLLTWGDETDGAGFAPSMNKPKAITKGEKEKGLISS